MNRVQPEPVLIGREHDDDGRLVALRYDSTPPPPVAGKVWLVAIDPSDNALRALTHAAEHAREMSCVALHLVHVVPWLAREAADAELAHRALGATAQARAMLDSTGLAWRLHVAMGDPAERILECARALSVDGLIIGCRGLNLVESLLFGSVTEKVIHHARVPVTVVP
ncbi:universal stress protein [Niveibacterium sp. 24ML]|uniref:universal stress protein n=1 Tax=Niveibacterium sp. 24ML TaxID=2985512 RepID=UPI0022701BD8|nr:universal stress protein [Niveibacterium sp. 24ML]MCX9156375.1 universal stress protein [Niveibacterium sp. 24ML]